MSTAVLAQMQMDGCFITWNCPLPSVGIPAPVQPKNKAINRQTHEIELNRTGPVLLATHHRQFSIEQNSSQNRSQFSGFAAVAVGAAN